MTRILLASLLVALGAGSAWGETVPLRAVQDNSLVMVDGEWLVNAGNASRLRMKGNQHMVAIAFDLAPIAGRLVTRAELVCHADAETISGVTVSTIAVPWDEMASTGLTAGVPPLHGWGYQGGRFPAVVGGNAFTLTHQAVSDRRDGVYRWAIPVDMVHAMATGLAHGLALHEHDADYGRNPTIFSREQSGKEPVLLVECAEQREQAAVEAPPEAAVEGRVVPVDRESATLHVRAPQHGFGYEVFVGGSRLGGHNVPLVRPGEEQVVHLRDLPEHVRGQETVVEVVTLSRTGQRSKRAVFRGRAFGDEPIGVSAPPAVTPAVAPHAGLGVIPLTDVYDRAGRPIGELPDDYRVHNALYDGQTITLTAAAGEVVGFQVLARGDGDVKLACRLAEADWRIDLFQAIYVPVGTRLVPDPLLPLPEWLSLSSTEDQAVVVDIYVPFDAASGSYAGRVELSDGRTVPLALEVLPVRLPEKASFLCEMNSYGLPDHVDDFYALQQVAYDHRVHANILHYSHHTAAAGARKSSLDMRLRSGRRMDNRRYDAIEPGARQGFWDDFAEAFGPYLDGSYFRDGHRGAIPAPGFYLTFHESWPLNCRPFFNGNPDAYLGFADSPQYAETYVNILSDFAREARRRGWNEAGFQVYFNNKGSLAEETKAPWILDEPASYWDYRALQYFGELTDRGRGVAGDDFGGQIDYRIDISRPEYCRGQLDGRADLWVVSSSAFQNYRRLVTDRIEQDGLKVWVYGTTNPVGESNRQVLAWALDAWQYGASGLVPWQTVDKTGQALSQPDQLGLFIFDTASDGRVAIRHSLRLKAYREAEQLIEVLTCVQQQRGWSASQLRAFLQRSVALAGRVRKQSEADAGTSEYSAGDLIAIDGVRQAAADLLR